jgi:hypothetical protein
MQHLPTTGPVLLATNCDTLQTGLQLVSVTDRATTVVLVEAARGGDGSLLRTLAQRTSVVLVGKAENAGAWKEAEPRAQAALARGDMLALGVDGQEAAPQLESFLRQLCSQSGAPVVPVFCGPLDAGAAVPRIRVVFGQAVSPEATLEELRSHIRELADWIKTHDDVAGIAEH